MRALMTLASASLLLACSGKDLDVGSNDASTGTQPLVSCDDASTPEDAGACPVTCCGPKVGNNTSLTSPDQAVTALVGKWQLCSTWPNAPGDVIGIELDTPTGWDGSQGADGGYIEVTGNMEFLVQGPSGPVPGQGFAYVSSWELDGQGSSYSMFLGGSGSSFLYSPCPAQLEIQYYYDAGAAAGGGTTADLLLVPY
jgi:hypothetical protein